MARMRTLSTVALVVAVTALAMAAWWSMLAAERAAVRANADGARKGAMSRKLALLASLSLLQSDQGVHAQRVRFLVSLVSLVSDPRCC